MKNSSQWQAIREDAQHQSLAPVALYVSVIGAKTDAIERTQIAKIEKATVKSGVPILILKLLDWQSGER